MKFKKSLTVILACVASASSMAVPSSLDPDALSGMQRTHPVGPHSKGVAVLRAQVLLERARFSPGEVDGVYGSNLRRAISGYQRAHALSVTGTLDEATWAALQADTAPILAPYIISEEDAAGPFEPVPSEMTAKAKMAALGYASAVEALGEKFHISPKLLTLLNPGKDFRRAGEEITVPNLADVAPLPKAAKVIVDQSDSTLRVIDAAGKTVAQFPATMGSARDPLPLGTWKVKGVARNPVFHYNPALFWDAEPGDIKNKIAAGPNNPVGVVWIDLSKEHYGIHGTPEPAKIGKTQSHGCIRLTNWDALTLAQSVAGGVDVLMQE